MNDLIQLYKKSLLIRIVEETIAEKYSEQEMRCPIHLSIGQEASATGVCLALTSKDILFSSHRSHAHYIAKNCNLKEMICELYGKSNGCVGGRGGSMHLQDKNKSFFASIPIVSSALGPAVGVALNLKRKKSKNVCVVYIGDGSIEEGIFHEAMNFISLNKLPLLIVCENNLYSVYTNIKQRQIDDNFLRFAKAFKINSLRANGNDAYKIFQISKKIIKNMRNNQLPFFLQLDTYRWREHCGPNYDNNIGYRSENEFKQWKKKCPIKKLEKLLLKKKIYNSKDLLKIKEKLRIYVDKVFLFAKKSPLPNPKTITNFVYK
jgi:TPP-dependent pyruvate/acetoin dehydrogenase alpha subunit